MVLSVVIAVLILLAAWLMRQPWRFQVELSGRDANFRLALTIAWLNRSWAASWPVSFPEMGDSPTPDAQDASSRPATERPRGTLDGFLRVFRAGRTYQTITNAVRDRTERIETWAEADVGLQDAAATALVVGVVWAGLGLWSAQLGGRSTPASPYRVRPSFQKPVLAASAGGIFRVTGVDIMNGIWLAFRRARRRF